MKKFILSAILSASVLCVCAADWNPIEKSVISGTTSMKIAYDVDKFQYAICEDIGTDCRITIYDGEFNVSKQFTLNGMVYNSYGVEVELDLETLWIESVDTGDLLVTRGLFTDDGKWCVVVRDNSQSGEKNMYVYNEDGVRLGKLPDNGATYGTPEAGDVFLSDITSGKPYYMTHLYDSAMGDRGQYIIWDFTGVSGLASPEARTTIARAYPNPLPAGASLTIDLPRVADSHTVIAITDVDGRQVYRGRVAEGESQVSVNPVRLRRGIHVYTVIYSDGETVSDKLAAE